MELGFCLRVLELWDLELGFRLVMHDESKNLGSVLYVFVWCDLSLELGFHSCTRGI